MPNPNVILLNGSTSSGKTSIALALQERLPGLWMHLAVDQFIAATSRKFFGVEEGLRLVPQPDGAVPVQLGPVGHAVLRSFHHAVRAVAADVPVIVDDVIFERSLMQGWLAALAELDVCFVGVHCTFEELERREVARGDRTPGQARAQFAPVHTHGAYDVCVDTTSTSPDACAAAIVDELARRPRPTAFERLGALRVG